MTFENFVSYFDIVWAAPTWLPIPIINEIPLLATLCLFAGLFFSIITRFCQVRLFGEMIHLIKNNKESESGISSFQALAVSLSGRVGTGNIAGVAAAIAFGGPGAVFWMWVVAFLGAATAYVESTLGQIYKETDDNGEYRGGPAYYFEKCLPKGIGVIYAWIFAIATIFACGYFLPGVQSNSLGNAMLTAMGGTDGAASFSLPYFGDVPLTKLIVALVVCSMLAFIIFGGIKRIAHFAQVVVPFMAAIYIIIALVIVAMNITEVPGIFALIISDAFSPVAALGAAIGWGVKRGVYSNEAGQGTGPHAAAAAEVAHPSQQGIVQAFSVYVDTLFICTATALMILITGAYNVVDANGVTVIANELANGLEAGTPAYTQAAVNSVFTGFGNPFVAFALFFFSFTTLLAYYYIAETNVSYLHRTIHIPGLTFALKILIIAATFYGTIATETGSVWNLGDAGVGIMAWLNIIGIILIFFMSKPTIKALSDYERQRKAGVKEYVFSPKELGINNATFWEQRLAKKTKK